MATMKCNLLDIGLKESTSLLLWLMVFFSVKSQEPKIKIEMTESVANKIENSINQHGLGFGLREAL